MNDYTEYSFENYKCNCCEENINYDKGYILPNVLFKKILCLTCKDKELIDLEKKQKKKLYAKSYYDLHKAEISNLKKNYYKNEKIKNEKIKNEKIKKELLL